MSNPITDLSVILDKDEYSRFEDENKHIKVIVFPRPTLDLDEPLTVELIKARRARDKVVYTTTVTVLGNVNSVEATIDLDLIRDSGGISLLRRGLYFVRVSNAAATVTATTADFSISIITAARLKKDFLFGLDLLANDVRSVLVQPQVVTGVQVAKVSKSHPDDFFHLTCDVTTTNKVLSWRGGPVVPVRAPGELLLRAPTGKDYIIVRTTGPDALPSVTTVEELKITKEEMPGESIRRYIRQALDWTENVALEVFIEPTQLVTDTSATPFAFSNVQGITDNTDYDFVKSPVTWYPTTAGHWIHFKFPNPWVVHVNNLYGEVAGARVLDVARSWLEVTEASGFCEIVPAGNVIGTTFEGLVWSLALSGQGSLPNFWRYNVTAGLRDVPFEVQELAARKAAVDAFTVAGQAFRGGYSSQSISRDGVSESITYTSSAIYGVYSSSIEEMKKYIRDELPRLRGKYRGPIMAVL